MFYPIIISFVFAILFAILLPSLFRRNGPGPLRGMVFYFLIIFLFTWAIGSWVTPIGPVAFNTSWLAYLAIAFLIMILIAALVPPNPPEKSEMYKTARRAEDRRNANQIVNASFGSFFWLLIIILIAMGIAGIIMI